MIQLRSIVYGFRVILGSWIVHLAAFLVLLFDIRPPNYKDDRERTQQAKIIYWVLLMTHLVLSIVLYLSLLWTKVFWDKMTILILFVVATTCYMQGNWFYSDRPPSDAGSDQAVFEQWLMIELFMIYSFVAAAALFLTISKFKKPILNMMSPLLERDYFCDVIELYSLQIDFS